MKVGSHHDLVWADRRVFSRQYLEKPAGSAQWIDCLSVLAYLEVKPFAPEGTTVTHQSYMLARPDHLPLLHFDTVKMSVERHISSCVVDENDLA